MLVNPFMPYTTTVWADGPHYILNAGVFGEVVAKLLERKACNPNDVRRFDDEIIKVIYDELVKGAGVDVMFHAALFDAEMDGPRIRAVRLAHNSGPIRVTGRQFIDSTGDGLLAALAGCKIMLGNELGKVMPMTLNFIVGGVDHAQMPTSKEIKAMATVGDKDTPALINTNLSCTSWRRPGELHFNAVRVPGNTLDPMDLSRAEIEGRRRAENYVQWLRARVPGFANAFLMKTGAHIGIRESRRVVGDYILNVDDFKRSAKFDDAIACCAYPSDIHTDEPNATCFLHQPPGEFYQVPYRCLTPKGKTNLLVAARSISVDIPMHGSVRIMPPVMNIGEAAGFAAAMCLPEGDIHKVDVRELQRRIVANGGIIMPDKHLEAQQ